MDVAGDAGSLAVAQGQRCKKRYRQADARRCLYPHPVADAPFPPITGKRSSPLCTAVRRRAFGRTGLPARPCTSHLHKEGLVPAIGRTFRGRDLHFVPLGPLRWWISTHTFVRRYSLIGLVLAHRPLLIYGSIMSIFVACHYITRHQIVSFLSIRPLSPYSHRRISTRIAGAYPG